MNLKKEIWTLLIALVGILLILYGVSSRAIELFAMLFGLIVVLLPEDDILIICCLACWMNVAQVFKLSVDGTSFYTILCLFFAVKQLVKYKEIEKDFLVILLIYAVYLFLGMGNLLIIAIKNVMMPVQLYVMAKSMDYQGLKKISGYFILGTIIESIAAINNSMIPGLSSFISNRNVFAVATVDGYVPTMRFSGLWPDPNYYSIHLLLGICICVLLYARKEINGVVFVAVVAVLTYFGAKTLSKSFILMFGIIMAYAYVAFLLNKQYGSVFLISIAFLVMILLIAAGAIDAFSLIIERLTEGIGSGGDFTTGRTDIWKNYLSYFYNNPPRLLFGIGLGGTLPFKQAPHNTYLEMLCYIGLIGTFVFCVTIYNAVAAAWNFEIRGSSMPFLCALLMYFFLGVYNSLDLQFELLLILGYLLLNKNDNSLVVETCKRGQTG